MSKDSEKETRKVERKDGDPAVESKVSLPIEDERPTPTYKVMAITISSLKQPLLLALRIKINRTKFRMCCKRTPRKMLRSI